MDFFTDSFKRAFLLFFLVPITDFRSVNTIRYKIEDEIDKVEEEMRTSHYADTISKQRHQRIQRLYTQFMEEYEKHLDSKQHVS